MARLSKALGLTEEEKIQLKAIIKKGTHKSRKILRAKVLLLMAENKSKSEIMAQMEIDSNRYHLIKRRYFSGGLSNALEENPRSGQPSKLNEKLEAQITSIACSTPPAGRSRWTLTLIQDRLIELQYVDYLSDETVRKALKKANLNLG